MADNQSSATKTTEPGTLDALLGKAKGVWDETSTVAGKAANTVGDKVNDAIGSDITGKVGKAASNIADKVGKTTSDITDKVGQSTDGLGEKTTGAAQTASSFIVENWENLSNFVKGLIGN
jgi:hypothetical protein